MDFFVEKRAYALYYCINTIVQERSDRVAWNFDEHTPVYLQIAERLRNDILNGVYEKDAQIPPVRQLAVIAAVNPNTVQRAFSELESEGLLCTKGTQGRFVTCDSEVLQAARKRAAKKLVNAFLKQAQNLNIGKAERMELLKEESEL